MYSACLGLENLPVARTGLTPPPSGSLTLRMFPRRTDHHPLRDKQPLHHRIVGYANAAVATMSAALFLATRILASAVSSPVMHDIYCLLPLFEIVCSSLSHSTSTSQPLATVIKRDQQPHIPKKAQKKSSRVPVLRSGSVLSLANKSMQQSVNQSSQLILADCRSTGAVEPCQQ